MASRVSVGINVNDNSRRALAALRQNMQRTSRDIRRSGGTVQFRVNVPAGTARRDLRRIQHSLRGMPVTINTRLDPPTPPARTMRQRIQLMLRRGVTLPVRLTTRGLRGTLRGIFRPLASFLGGILNDGIGQGVLSAFKAAGPAGVAIMAAAITTGAALIGAALAGVLVLGFGLAFVGLAGYLAVVSGKVTKQWGEMTDRLKDKFKGAAEPIIPVLERGIRLIEKMGNSFAPVFKDAIATAAPALDSFLANFMEGFKDFGKRAFEPMMKGFDTFILAFGPEWRNFMKGLGDAFGNLGRTAQKHSGELAMALRLVLGLITTLVDIINFFANVWVGALRVATYTWGLLITGVANGAELMIGGFGMILQAATTAFGWVPGIGGKLKAANESFKKFGEGAVTELRRMGQESKDWGLRMDQANKRRKLEVDISSLQTRLKQARQDLANTANKKAKAKVQANIDALTAALRRARADLNALNGKTVNTYVNVWRRNQDYGGNSVTGARAHGGVVGAAATGGVRNNMTLVGEQGPELVSLPGGSRVRSNSDSRRLAGQSGGNGEPAVLRLEAANDDMSRLLLKILRNAIRVQGGNVQVVLGKG